MLRTSMLLLLLYVSATVTTEASDQQQADCRQPDFASLKKKYPQADFHCVAFYEDTDSCCRDPDSKNCGQPDSLNNQVNDVITPSKGSAPGDAMENVKTQLNLANKSYHAASRCRARLRIAHEYKAGGCKRYIDNKSPGSRPVDATPEEVEQTRNFDDEAARIYGNYTGCLKGQGDQSKLAADDALKIYQRSTNDAHYMFNCINRDQMGEASAQCLLVDSKDSRAAMVPTQDSEITVGRTTDSGCTVALGGTSANGASHCEMNANTQVQKVDNDGNVVTGAVKDVNNEGIKYGKLPDGSYEDSSVFKPDSKLSDSTKPFDVVMLSDHVQGCQPANGSILCSPAAMEEIKQIKIAGFPVQVYGNGPDGYTVPSTVLVTSGPAYWDAENQKMLINAYGSNGNSGGPVYIPAGTKIGGYVTENPTIVGTFSGFYTGGDQQTVTNTRNIVSVPVNTLDQYSQLYAPPNFTSRLIARGRDVFR